MKMWPLSLLGLMASRRCCYQDSTIVHTSPSTDGTEWRGLRKLSSSFIFHPDVDVRSAGRSPKRARHPWQGTFILSLQNCSKAGAPVE
ncbi:hypothetical protein IWZ00DRAFT_236810 [Phyllosticta capitalensis]